MFLAVTNESTIIPSALVAKAARACAAQIKLHVSPIWDRFPAQIGTYDDKKQIPAAADILSVRDDSDDRGRVGYHRLAPDGRACLRAFVKPILNHGGELLTTSLSVSSVMSHEICEWLINRSLNLRVDGPEGQYALEICDPVAEDVYEIDGVSVSNFVYPKFFDVGAPSTSPFDHMRRVRAPLTTSPGGYMHIRKNGESQMIRGLSAGAQRILRATPSNSVLRPGARHE